MYIMREHLGKHADRVLEEFGAVVNGSKKQVKRLLSQNDKMLETARKYFGRSGAVRQYDQPAGHTCPMANICKSRVVISGGERTIEQDGKVLCYAVKSELQYNHTFERHWTNHYVSRLDNFASIMTESIQSRPVLKAVRIHASGDFYNGEYFFKWYEITRRNPNVMFWGYTKQATFKHWLDYHPRDNFKLVYSHGGLLDDYAKKNGLNTCTIWTGGELVSKLRCFGGDVDDFEAILNGEDFSLAIH